MVKQQNIREVKMTVLICDTETTGVAKTDQVIELAYLEVGLKDLEVLKQGLKEIANFYTNLHENISRFQFKPTVPINPHAYEVHGIGLAALHGKPCATTVTVPEHTYMVGHVISFDKGKLIGSNPTLAEQLDKTKYICTRDLAKAIQKNLGIEYENHKLDTLVRHYYPTEYEVLVQSTHDAAGDVVKTILVLLAMLEHLPNVETWEELFEFQQTLKKVK